LPHPLAPALRGHDSRAVPARCDRDNLARSTPMEKAASSGGTRRRVRKGFSLGEVNSQTPLDRIARPEPGPIKVAHSKEICGGARTALSQQGAAPSSRLRPLGKKDARVLREDLPVRVGSSL
jgi:hypothetical protein